MEYKVGDKVKISLPEGELYSWGKDVNGKVFTVVFIEKLFGLRIYHLNDGKRISYVSTWLEPVETKGLTVYEKENLFEVGDRVRVNIPVEDYKSWYEPVQGKVFSIVYILHWFGNKIYCLNDRIGISYVAEWLDPVQE